MIKQSTSPIPLLSRRRLFHFLNPQELRIQKIDCPLSLEGKRVGR
jgi:hypothetical protein